MYKYLANILTMPNDGEKGFGFQSDRHLPRSFFRYIIYFCMRYIEKVSENFMKT